MALYVERDLSNPDHFDGKDALLGAVSEVDVVEFVSVSEGTGQPPTGSSSGTKSVKIYIPAQKGNPFERGFSRIFKDKDDPTRWWNLGTKCRVKIFTKRVAQQNRPKVCLILKAQEQAGFGSLAIPKQCYFAMYEEYWSYVSICVNNDDNVQVLKYARISNIPQDWFELEFSAFENVLKVVARSVNGNILGQLSVTHNAFQDGGAGFGIVVAGGSSVEAWHWLDYVRAEKLR